MLNLYLVLGTETVLKSIMFINMVTFLVSKKQLKQVMIEQVKDIANLSGDWDLTTDERVDLYFACAQALSSTDDSTSAFKVYYEAFKILDG
jgi:hypothetical protein